MILKKSQISIISPICFQRKRLEMAISTCPAHQRVFLKDKKPLEVPNLDLEVYIFVKMFKLYFVIL